MSNLLLLNLPHNLSNPQLHSWVESCGVETDSIRVNRNLVVGMSTALVELRDGIDIHEAVSILNGKRMRNQIILATEPDARLKRQ